MKKLLLLIPLLALTLVGCGKEEEQEKKLPERFVEVSKDEGATGGSTDIHALQDKETGCQYILVRRPSGGTAMSPILKPNGKPYCVEVKHEKTRGN
uniref:DUF6440 domain-containing protein n=1 Tax=Bacillus phage Adastra TaxID=3143958 RepID=A0AAU8BCM1_9CAUD